MRNYLDLLQKIMDHGVDRPTRNGNTRALFCEQLRWDLSAGFPILTTKKVSLKNIAAELIWFLSGSIKVKDLQAMGCHIWDADSEKPAWTKKREANGIPAGELGRIYGAQWRDWIGPDRIKYLRADDGSGADVVEFLSHTDQITKLVERLKNDPWSRYHLVIAYNPAELDKVVLPACHAMFQCFVKPVKCEECNGTGEYWEQHDYGTKENLGCACCEGTGEFKVLSLFMHQRSCDVFLGVPYNIASYALLTHLLCRETGYWPGELIINFADVHIYTAHFDAVKEQLTREPKKLPYLMIDTDNTSIFKYKPEMFTLDKYEHHPAIKAPLLVS